LLYINDNTILFNGTPLENAENFIPATKKEPIQASSFLKSSLVF